MSFNNIEQQIKVSIVMSAYNAERFLGEAIESILSQSFKDFEFLIMDDGSTDFTWNILQEYAQKDSRIKLFQQENKGLGPSLNYLISIAKGELIARMDADDISHIDRLQQQVDYLIKHPDVGVLSTARLMIAPNGLAYEIVRPPDDQKILADLFSKGINLIAHGSVIMRKNALTSLNEPPYKPIRAQDFDLWKRLIKFTRFAVIQTPLYSLRQRSGSITDRWLNRTSIINKHQDYHWLKNSISELDNKPQILLAMNLSADKKLECFLNSRAFFLNKKYSQALNTLVPAFFCENIKYRVKSFFLLCLIILGPLGVFIYQNFKKNQCQYYQY